MRTSFKKRLRISDPLPKQHRFPAGTALQDEGQSGETSGHGDGPEEKGTGYFCVRANSLPLRSNTFSPGVPATRRPASKVRKWGAMEPEPNTFQLKEQSLIGTIVANEDTA